MRSLLRCGLAALASFASLQLAVPDGLKFKVSFPASSWNAPFSGRVVLYLSKGHAEPRLGPDWFNPEPMFMAKFKDVKPGEPMVIDTTNAVGFPGSLASMKPGSYFVQAVVDLNLGGRAIGDDPGNLYSDAVKLDLDPTEDKRVDLICNHEIVSQHLQESELVKEVAMPSTLLSKWYGRATFMYAGVVLPPEFKTEPTRKFPILYVVPGFGGTQLGADQEAAEYVSGIGEPFIVVVLNPDCPGGHSVFADSDNNGPWGTALTTELIPFIEAKYRAYGKTGARFVAGHSSGGWSSLWLQVTYPDVFGGCWSTSPDPVDFRDYQQVNLYKPGLNMFTDEKGKPRPLARQGLTPVIFYKTFSDMEKPLRGEQLYSFDAVFSPMGLDGEPVPMYNRSTGAIDPGVVENWKRYDIDLTLRTNWKTLGPKLKGKLHVYTGDIDTFYLDGAVRLLKADLKALGSDAYVEVWPGDHFTVMSMKLVKQLRASMLTQFRTWKAGNG